MRPRRSGRPQALAVSLSRVTQDALRHRNFAERSLIVDWASIAGPDIARICHPLKLSFARRDRRMDGTLALRVQAGQATRVQHLEPLLLERINGYLGYRAVASLRLQPGPPPRPAAAGAEDSPGPKGAAADKREAASPIPEPALRSALQRLGQALKKKP
ncbi:MAG: DUF721 domain-containing protein [Kiloniellaceae bacterium]